MPSWLFPKALSFLLPLVAAVLVGAKFFEDDILKWILGGLIEGGLMLFLMIRLVRRVVYNDPALKRYKTGLVDQEQNELAGKMQKSEDVAERNVYQHHIDILENLKRVLNGDEERRLLKDLRRQTNSWRSIYRRDFAPMFFLVALGASVVFMFLQRSNTYSILESCSIVGVVVLAVSLAGVLAVELHWETSATRKLNMSDLIRKKLVGLHMLREGFVEKADKDISDKLIRSTQAVHIFLLGGPCKYEPLAKVTEELPEEADDSHELHEGVGADAYLVQPPPRT